MVISQDGKIVGKKTRGADNFSEGMGSNGMGCGWIW